MRNVNDKMGDADMLLAEPPGMSRPRRALAELARRERGLELACEAFAAHAGGVPASDLRAFAAEHRAAADLLDERLASVHGRRAPYPLRDRLAAWAAIARGTAAALGWLADREMDLLGLYRARLCVFDAPTRRAIERRLLPQAVMRLAAADRLAFVAADSPLVSV